MSKIEFGRVIWDERDMTHQDFLKPAREILLFDTLNLARICPYIKGKSDRFWLLKHIKQSLKELS